MEASGFLEATLQRRSLNGQDIADRRKGVPGYIVPLALSPGGPYDCVRPRTTQRRISLPLWYVDSSGSHSDTVHSSVRSTAKFLALWWINNNVARSTWTVV